MNPDYLGDSYDVVKRFFCSELKALGYQVCIKPMLTGSWSGDESAFYRFIGVTPEISTGPRTALFVDPDTGVHLKPSKQHISIQQLSEVAAHHGLVFSFDQSFSRQMPVPAVMQSKLVALREKGTHGLYYNSHARFLFAAARQDPLSELRAHLVSLGMPAHRLVSNDA